MPGNRAGATFAALVAVWQFCIAGIAFAGQGASNQDSSGIRIFDGRPKVIVVNGYSTSFRWPHILQRKLDRYMGGQRVVQVELAVAPGTPIARWIDVESGQPRQPWLDVVRPALKRAGDLPVIALAQQSLQWVFGRQRAGIRTEEDVERIRQGADAMEKYVTLLRADGADLVFVAVHIYKHEMEPVIGNERCALDELMRRKIPGVERGPDVWTPTRRLYPRAFQRDLKHPNAIGTQVMAQHWFETLLDYDGLEVPAWSRREMKAASQGGVDRPVNRRAPGAPALRVPPGVKVVRDVEYARVGEKRLLLDLYLPEEPEGPLPVIVWIHGGAWLAGSKDAPHRAVGLVPRGYAVASISYRFSHEALFPAQIEDCKAAVRWLRAHAAPYGLDADHVGAWGPSAGGHLAALLGTTGDVSDLEGAEGHLEYSSRVQAVCDWFGPTDFLRMDAAGSSMRHDAPDSPESRLIGGPIRQNVEKVRRANPITYISPDDPPFLIMHGAEDRVVPLNQSQLLYEALKEAGVDVTFVALPGEGHGFRGAYRERVGEFFDRHLKGTQTPESGMPEQ